MIVFFGHAKTLFAMEKFQLAVDYFFILSGFVLTHAYKDKLSNSNFLRSFIRDRVARLYPLHLATLFILMFLNIWFVEITKGQWLEQGWSYQDGRTYTLSLHLLLLNNIGLTPGGPSWNAPAWSISVEFWINILLAGIALKMRKYLLAFCIAAFMLAYSTLFFSIGSLGDFYKNIGFINTGMLRGIAGMTAGVLCYAAYQKILPAIGKRSRISIILLALLSIVFQFCLIAGWPHFEHAEFLIVPISAAAVISLALLEGVYKNASMSGALEWLGSAPTPYA
ncbi:hypothetical protein BI344_03760 [Chromobacterium sphagni]|uniref:Acyltransferase 3 domain-containing protein n=2 Tax=Chromobacterium sphagni TaxID=1903179 RepID=A0ABX3CH19_9NEIS|nr:hypothetical protein BI344_03760 [Chromobacterium sphagni]